MKLAVSENIKHMAICFMLNVRYILFVKRQEIVIVREASLSYALYNLTSQQNIVIVR